ncbi:LysM peptidoglycan-binding domain-containing protein [Lysinibacillus sp. BW-2-10]|uniref:LysM peptidoglycan-binding domain-containing protein n=1 Tax=Lysinibacillus sp. BW-2-10 TaxID=2590030 RepID=UPI00117CEFA5|nr:LysM peptidoglycan-binding domain-containing protein [Lysinibacillus sp. BW-2-10]TSI03237.1 LysM peptidoglycan-binding domain-containing protein [Lysinibacillus sp. BW-2-10]
MRIHIVQKGETLWRIAKQYGIGLDELKALNAHLANPDYIVPGMEIILPDTAMPTKSTMTKEQLTAPMSSKEMQTMPKEKLTEEMPMPMPMPTKEQMTAPIKEEMTAPMPMPIKEEMTKPIKEEMTAPMPMPQPMPQFDMTPQFHLDFAPQMHFQQPQPQMQPQPMPMPMPQPQPIFIEMPQIQMPQPQVQVQPVMEKEKEVEYVPVPQPQIVYVPYMQPVYHPMPCECFEPHHYHHQSPCGCHEQHHHHQSPCGCHEQHHHHQSPCGCHEQHHHHQSPCGCHEQQQYHHQLPVGYHEQYPQVNPCGCQGSMSPEMMPYGLPYFEPNYDVSHVAGQEQYMEQSEQQSLPDWLLDSSEMESMSDKVEYDMNAHNQYDNDAKSADMYHEMLDLDSRSLPQTQSYYGHNDSPHQMMPPMSQHGMPYQNMPYSMNPMTHQNQMQPMNPMMPQQQMMYPADFQSYPYMNPYSPHYTPWKY